MAYIFRCPLEGCEHTTMISEANDENTAAEELTTKAEEHLRQMHSDVHKTHEEVSQDIHSHMMREE